MKLCPRTLTQFAAVARESSFTRAAATLGIAQPWLSARIKKLEDQLGYKLIDRSTRHFELTPQGRHIFDVADRLSVDLQEAEVLAERMRASSAKVLRVGAPPYSHRIQSRKALLADFAAHHPQVSVELDVGWSPRLSELVNTGSLDVAFTYGTGASEQVERLELGSFGVRLFFLEDDPLAHEPEVHREMLRGRRIVVFNRGLNPALFEHHFAPFARAGASLVECSETEDIFEQLGREHDLLIAKSDFVSAPPGKGYLHRDVAEHPRMPWHLVRRRREDRRTTSLFWDFATSWVSRSATERAAATGGGALAAAA